MQLHRALRSLVLLVLPSITAPLAATPPLEAYGELPGVENMVISPTGNRVALTVTLACERVIMVLDGDNKPIDRIAVDDMKIRSIDFASDDLLLIRRSATEKLGFGFVQEKYEFHQAIIVNLGDKGPAKSVFADRQGLAKATFGFYGVRTVGGRPKA